MLLRTLFSRLAIWLYTLLLLSLNILILIAISRGLAPSLLIEHDSGPAIDHIAFWAAGWLANHGDAVAAYDDVAIAAVQSAGLGYEYTGVMPWFYPPLAQIMSQPFAHFSLIWSFIIWNMAGLALFAFVSWRILADPLAVLLAVASGGFTALFSGQIGLFIAAIAGLCLLSLRRTDGGGMWLAFLLLKPQTVFVIPLVLALTGRWRSIAVACLTGAGLVAVSALWLGGEVWLVFIGTIVETADLFLVDTASSVLWDQYVSAYGVALYNGAPFELAVTVQGGVSLIAVTAAVLALRTLGPTDAAAAIILYAAVVASPRIYVYDISILAIGALFHVRASLSKGWARWEPPLFAVGILLLEISFAIVIHAAVLIGPLFLVGAYFRHVRGARPLPHCN